MTAAHKKCAPIKGRLIDHRSGGGIFSPGALLAVGVSTAGFVTGGFAFYYKTNDAIEQQHQEIVFEQTARQKLSDEYLANAQKTADGIAALNVQAAVQTEQSKSMAKSLDHISEQLSSIVVRKSE